ncbi:SUMF1/EgtB/PvdO family nonheme iron enzyme [Sorangium sp. So ce726]|uniref:SUMF1/EgtB/PvdO family nonheme iron enzyme n=1 Tax=Sorangium sp. So ce726 TaxID=3133319 RepID=UPI003F6380D9
MKRALVCDPYGWPTWTDAPAANEDKPIVCATWLELFASCAWYGGRLPTQAEMNYAAAGGENNGCWMARASSSPLPKPQRQGFQPRMRGQESNEASLLRSRPPARHVQRETGATRVLLEERICGGEPSRSVASSGIWGHQTTDRTRLEGMDATRAQRIGVCARPP